MKAKLLMGIKKTLSDFVFKDKSSKKSFFANIVNLLFFITVSLTITIGRIYPIHYIANILFLIMSLAMMIYVFLYSRFFIDHFVVLIIIFNILIIFSVILNNFAQESFTLNLLTLGMLPTYYYFSSFDNNRKIALKFFTLSYVVFNIFFLIMYFEDFVSLNFSYRLGDKIANQNDLATYLVTAHSIYFYLVLKKNIFYLPLLFLNIIEMIATGSRSGLINILIMSFIVLFLVFGRAKRKQFIIISIVVFALAYLTLYLPLFNDLRLRFHNLFISLFTNSTVDESVSNRISLLLNSVEVFLENPFFGKGREFAFYSTFDGGVAHNTFIEIASSYGVFSLIIFVVLFLLSFSQSNHIDPKFKLILVISFLIFYLTLSGQMYKPPYFALPILTAMPRNKPRMIPVSTSISHPLTNENNYE
ncbi:MAG: O-antigen ligase family protein [Acholeplasmataceae bacterium]